MMLSKDLGEADKCRGCRCRDMGACYGQVTLLSTSENLWDVHSVEKLNGGVADGGGGISIWTWKQARSQDIKSHECHGGP